MLPWRGYLWAVVITAIAGLVRWAAAPIWPAEANYEVFYLSVVFVAAIWGRWPGLTAVALAVVVGSLPIVLREGPGGLAAREQLLHLAVLVGVGGLAILPQFVAARVRAAAERQAETQQAVREALEMRQLALDAAEMGTWEFDPRTLACLVGERGQMILRVPQRRFHYAQFLDLLHPEDRARVDQANRTATAPDSDGRYDAEYRVIWPDGSVHWVAAKGQAFFEGEGDSRRAVRVVGTAMDITPRKETECALREAIELQQIALDTAELGTWASDPRDPTGLSCVGDERCQAIVGVPSGPYHHQDFLKSVHPDDRARVEQAAAAALDAASSGRYEAEYRVVRPDGSVRWVAAKGATFFQGAGETRHAVRGIGTVMDITARKEAEDALRTDGELRQIVLDAAAMGTWELDPRTGVSSVDDRCQAILGVRHPRFQYAEFLDALLPEDRERVEHACQEALAPASDGHYDTEHRVLHADGSVRWVAAKGQAFFEGEGTRRHAVRMVGMVMDITARKEAEERLRASEELLRQAVQVSGVGIFYFDVRTQALQWSPRLREIRGFTPDQPASIPALLECLHPDDRQKMVDAMARSDDPTGDGLFCVECRVIWPDGSVHWTSEQGQMLFEGEGPDRHPVRSVGVVLDITERKLAEEKIRTSEELLQQAVRVSGLAVFDHDLHSNRIAWSPNARETFGCDDEGPQNVPEFLACIHPADRPRIADLIERARGPYSGGACEFEARVLRPDGTIRWLSLRAQVFFEGEGSACRPTRSVGVMADITERKVAEEHLRTSEELLRQAMSVSGLAVFDHDLYVDRIVWSPEIGGILGCGGEGPRDISAFLEYIHPDDRSRVSAVVQHCLDPNGDGRGFFEARALWSNGTVRWLNLQAQVFFEGEGPARRPARTVGVVADVTERREAEEQLRASEELFHAFFDNVAVGTAQVDLEGRFLQVNDRYCEITGYSREELLHMTRTDVIHPDDWPRDEVRLVEFHQGRPSSCEIQERYVRKDGSVIWVQVNRSLVRGADGRPLRVVGVVQDITEAKRAEEQLRASEELFRAFFDNVAVGTAQVDLEGRFLQVNDRYCEITGYSREELLHMTRTDVIHPDDWPRDEVRLLEFQQGRPSSCEIQERYVRKDGSVIWVQVNRSLVRGPDGRPLRVVGIAQDITARKNAEEALEAARRNAEQAKAAAEAANQAKSQFLAHMSHELRTPMNSILGMTELALQESLSGVVRDCLQTVKDSADSLLVLINEVLDLSRIEAGALPIDAKPFLVGGLLEDTVKALAVRAFEKGLELACYVAPEVPDRLIGDPSRLRQILTNLLGNAIKFTAHGEVVVRTEVISEDAAEVRLRFSVSDTGIGIAPEEQQRIFAPFVQADPSMTRRYGGSGLGLAIVSRLVDMLGGKVELQSQPGQGSTFSVVVALRRPEVSAPPDRQRVCLESFREQPVLVVQRQAVNRRILEQILCGWSMRPVLADDVLSARTQLDAAAAGQQFPLLILDPSLPGAEELCSPAALGTEGALKPAVVLTVSPAERQQVAARFGFGPDVVWLEKPISPMAVATALGQVSCGVRREQGPPTSAADQAAVRSLRILLAEDTPANQKLAVRILSRRGHLVEVAENGAEALERLRRERFDLVLMDVQMPVMDGFQATAAIRKLESPAQAQIPIIAMTAHALKGDQEKCLAAGMDAYISKPINSRELIALVEWIPDATCARSGVPDFS
jgi:PAS domain S-box-containing protein